MFAHPLDAREGPSIRLGGVDLRQWGLADGLLSVLGGRAGARQSPEIAHVGGGLALVEDLRAKVAVVAPVLGPEELAVEVRLGVLHAVESRRALHGEAALYGVAHDPLCLHDAGVLVHREAGRV